MEDKGQILLYQTPDGESRIEVRLQGETVWLNQEQMAELFQRNISTISRHINNAFEEGELKKEEVIAFFANTTQHGDGSRCSIGSVPAGEAISSRCLLRSRRN